MNKNMAYYETMRVLKIITLLAVLGCTPKPISIAQKSVPMPAAVVKREICNAPPLRIAIIDTGFGFQGLGDASKLCKFGHRNFSDNNDFNSNLGTKDAVPVDHHSHGTNIAGVIDKFAKGENYCLVIIKFYDPLAPTTNNLEATVKAFKYAKSLKVDIVNYSAGGVDFSPSEEKAVKEYLNSGGKLVAAAGNESSDVTQKPYYPAMYDRRIVSVGNLDPYTESPARSSNYGTKVSRWEIGTQTANGITETGTSQAAAVATGKIIKSMKRKCIDTVSK